jgi:hypothetical protein
MCGNRVEDPSGSFNLGQCRELVRSDTYDRATTGLGDFVKREAAKSSTVKGGKPLTGQVIRRRCRTAKTSCLG